MGIAARFPEAIAFVGRTAEVRDLGKTLENMKKDIPNYKVEDIAIAVVPRKKEDGTIDEELWDIYLLNLKEEAITTVLINSRGYGSIGGDRIRTTVLRHYFEEIGPLQVVKVEPIQTKVFGLTNEYWVSFVHEEYMYDKKYVFVKGSINRENFTTIPFLNEKGVMIR